MRRLHEAGKLTPEAERFMAETRSEEELYELASDPHELNNLANDPSYRDVIQSMRLHLETWMRETGDQGHIPEDQRIIDFYENKMKEILT